MATTKFEHRAPATPRRPPARRSRRQEAPRRRHRDARGSAARRTAAPRAEAADRPSQVAAEAARQLLELTGKEAEGVTGLERTDDGWKVAGRGRRGAPDPDTTDVLALYEVEVDERRRPEGYRRLRRYARGVPGED